MVFVKVRETYDLQTTKNKMTLIGIHTPKPGIIKQNYPGLLMQCRAYRPVSADVRLACASVLPMDPLGVGTDDGDVAPEDLFNPILYKAMSNKGMSQLEARIQAMRNSVQADVVGPSADVDVDSVVTGDQFGVYYGLLANTHDWKHANPQSGLSMTGLKPLVYEMVYNFGDSTPGYPDRVSYPQQDGNSYMAIADKILGKAKPMPFINCTSYSLTGVTKEGERSVGGFADAGFPGTEVPSNCEIEVPYINCVVGAICVPPSRLHELFYRMVVEWTIEFSSIRPIGEIVNWTGLGMIGAGTHYQNYSYESTKEAITGSSDTMLDNDSCMVSSNVGLKKVM